MSSTVANADMRIMWTLCAIAEHHKKTYAFPTQETIINLLHTWYGRRMSRRTACRHLATLENQGWLVRVRRHRRSNTGSLELHSTLYRFTGRAWRAFASLGNLAKAAQGWVKSRNHASRCDTIGTISNPIRVKEPPSATPAPLDIGNNVISRLRTLLNQ